MQNKDEECVKLFNGSKWNSTCLIEIVCSDIEIWYDVLNVMNIRGLIDYG